MSSAGGPKNALSRARKFETVEASAETVVLFQFKRMEMESLESEFIRNFHISIPNTVYIDVEDDFVMDTFEFM